MTPTNRVTCSLAAEFLLVNENIQIQEEKITQLYVIQSKHDPLLWFGILFVDSGNYMGAVIRFNMFIPTNYPNSSCPKIFFDPIPYHPLIDPKTGQLDTKIAFPDWDSNTHKLHQLLSFVKRVIYHVEIYINQIGSFLEQAGYKLGEDCETRKNSIDKGRFEGTFVDNPGTIAVLTGVTDGSQVNNLGNDKTKLDDASDIVTTIGRNLSSSQQDYLNDRFINLKHTIEFMKLYHCDTIDLKKLTDSFIQRCSYHIYDQPKIPHGEDENALRFTQWDPYLHETTRDQILAGRFAPTSLFATYHKDSDRVSFVPGKDTD